MRPPHDELGLRVGASLILACAVACSTPDERPTRTHDDPHAPAADTSVAAAVDEEDDEEPVRDGKYLYTRNCAGCHNDNGDGLGPTIVQMGLKARSFAEGHFAFGNTRESIFRTIASGVPGRSPMPGFAMVLDEDERWLIVDYVRTLMPKEEEVDESLSVMHVKDEPVIVRGMLRPIVEGAPEWPRGLLVGLPEGFTFAYRADDVRLLAVYQGEFVDRRDWYDRGGSKLKVLGQLIYAADGDPKRESWIDDARTERIAWDDCVAKLRSTATRDGRARIRYVLSVHDGAEVELTEAPRVNLLAIGPALVREIELHGEHAVRLPVGIAEPGSEMRARAGFEPLRSWMNAPVVVRSSATASDDASRRRSVAAIAAQDDEAGTVWTIAVGSEVALVGIEDGWYCVLRPDARRSCSTMLVTLTTPSSFTLDDLNAILPEVVR